MIPPAFTQNKNYVLNVCEKLCSKEMAGRGYSYFPNSKNKTTGIENAHRYIIREIKKVGGYNLSLFVSQSKNFSKKINYNQLIFSDKKNKNDCIPITFNNIIQSSLYINNKIMILGKDYLPEGNCPSINFSGPIERYDSSKFINYSQKIILTKQKKLMFSPESVQENFTVIHLNDSVFNHLNNQPEIRLNIVSKIQTTCSHNIYAFIPGTQFPDSFIVFSAHYDHLGNIDTTYFPGANDNASGVAVLLDFLTYFKKNPPRYSVAFFFFTGEEIGLVGSKYYVTHPLFDLKRIKLLINLDLMGGGSEGIMVVNGTVFQNEFDLLKQINQKNNYNLPIKARGKAQNSDHYWFSENGVKSFFIYTLGDVKAYHSIYDTLNGLSFNNYEKIFDLIKDWIIAQ